MVLAILKMDICSTYVKLVIFGITGGNWEGKASAWM